MTWQHVVRTVHVPAGETVDIVWDPEQEYDPEPGIYDDHGEEAAEADYDLEHEQ